MLINNDDKFLRLLINLNFFIAHYFFRYGHRAADALHISVGLRYFERGISRSGFYPKAIIFWISRINFVFSKRTIDCAAS